MMMRTLGKVVAGFILVLGAPVVAAEQPPSVGVSVFYKSIKDVMKERGVSLEEACALFRSVGVTGFDCNYADKGLGRVVAAGMKPINLFGTVTFRVPDRGEAQMQEFLAIATRYDVPRIMVIPDYFSDGEEHEEEFVAVIDGFRRFVTKAKKVGVTVMVETFGHKANPCSYAKYIKRLLDEVPELKFALDTGNLHFAGRGEDIVEVAHYAAKRIAHIHLKDWQKGLPPIGPKGERNLTTLGLGAIPNEALIRYAKSIGYCGWYTLEHPLKGDTLCDTARQVAVLKYWLRD